MNVLQQFRDVFKQEKRAVARLVVQQSNDTWQGETSSGKQLVVLVGTGYKVGQTVFYDMTTRRILETAPDLEVVDLVV